MTRPRPNLIQAQKARGLLARLGISQRLAARRLGVRSRDFRHCLTGRNEIPPDVMHRLEELVEEHEREED